MSVSTTVAEETAKVLAREYVADLDRASYFDNVADVRAAVTDAYEVAYLQGVADALDESVATLDEIMGECDELSAGYEAKLEELVAHITELESQQGGPTP